VRIAISGAHCVGKTTLAEALAAALPHHDFIAEPYFLLEEEGYDFAALVRSRP
jgi:uridine kinase